MVFIAKYFNWTGSAEPKITYTVQMGSTTCKLNVWETDKPGIDLMDTKEAVYYVTRFSLPFSTDPVQISTNYSELTSKTWTLNRSPRVFKAELNAQMTRCMGALAVERAHKLPIGISNATDRCVPQVFRVNYPALCTSLPFAGGWEKGQTVTSSGWTVSLVRWENEANCVNAAKAQQYDVKLDEFTDRLIQVAERQLRPGLNRICNNFTFSTVLRAPDGSDQEYGPWDFNLCVSLY